MSDLPARESMTTNRASVPDYMTDDEECVLEAYRDGELLTLAEARQQIIDSVDWPRLEERVCRRVHAKGPASLNASARSQLARAIGDVRAALAVEPSANADTYQQQLADEDGSEE